MIIRTMMARTHWTAVIVAFFLLAVRLISRPSFIVCFSMLSPPYESYVTLPLDTFMVATVTTSRSRKKKIATVEARSIRKSSIA